MTEIEVALNPEGMVHLRSPTGVAAVMPEEDLAGAIASGYTPMTREEARDAEMRSERETLGQQALTAGEAALSSATFGLSDYVGRQLSPEWAYATRERREINPSVTIAGEIGGALATALATGGGSVAGAVRTIGAPARTVMRAGSAIERGLVSGAARLGWTGESLASRAALRGLSMAASGAVEGGVYEVSRGMVDAILGDADYTAEQLTASLKRGIQWGAIGGGVAGVGSTLVGAAGKRVVDSMLRGRTLEEGLSDFAEKSAVSAVTGNVKKLAEQQNRLGRKLLDAEIPLNKSAAAEKAIASKADEAVERLGAVAKRLDESGATLPGGDVLKRAETQLNKLESGALGSQKETIVKLREKIAMTNSGQANLFGANKQLTWSDITELRQSVDKVLKDAPEEAVQHLASVRTTIDESLIEAAKLGGDDALHAAAAQGDETAKTLLGAQGQGKSAIVEAVEDLRDWELLKAAKKDVDVGGGLVDTAGQVWTGVAFLKGLAYGGLGVIPGMAISAGASMVQARVRNFLQERGTAWLARVADDMARAESRKSSAISTLMTKELSGTEELVSAIQDSVTDPSTPGPIIRRAAQSGNYAERFEVLRGQLAKLRSDPKETAQILEDLTGGLAEVHPEIAMAVHRQALADAEYLASKMPAGVTTSISPMRGEAVVGRYDQERALAIADALNDPDGVVEDLASGSYDADQWDALKARRPLRYQEIRRRVLESYAMNADAMTFQRRNLIGTALDFPADWSQMPENAMALQSLGSSSPPPETAPQGRGIALDPKLADQLTTPSQDAAIGA